MMVEYDASNHAAVDALIEAFARAATELQPSNGFDSSLARITATAVQTVGGCDAASISLLGRDGPVTRGATSSLAEAGDRIQYEENEGPCLDAALQARWVYTPDLGVDPRWLCSARRLRTELGVGSMFSARLAVGQAPSVVLGGLNLYSRTKDGFGTQDQMLAALLSSLGAVVVSAAREQENLREAIASRQVIGEAIGILRAQSNVTSQAAFEMLSRASQRMNVKLRDVARQIADGSRNGREPHVWSADDDHV